jgi:hypothetical protein
VTGIRASVAEDRDLDIGEDVYLGGVFEAWDQVLGRREADVLVVH